MRKTDISLSTEYTVKHTHLKADYAPLGDGELMPVEIEIIPNTARIQKGIVFVLAFNHTMALAMAYVMPMPGLPRWGAERDRHRPGSSELHSAAYCSRAVATERSANRGNVEAVFSASYKKPLRKRAFKHAQGSICIASLSQSAL